MLKSALRQHLLKTASEDDLRRWFDPLRLDGDMSAGEVAVHFPHPYFATWFFECIKDIFEDQLFSLLGPGRVVAYHYPDPGPAAAQPAVRKNESALGYPFGHEYSLEKFATGKRNQFPLATAREVAKSGEPRFNPFIIRGANGSGKTHLLKAIGNELAKRRDRKSIFLGNVEDLSHLYLVAHQRDAQSWREYLRGFEFFLLDDLQVLARHDHLQEEIILLFDFFHDTKRQMVFCVKDEDGFSASLSPSLRSRLDWGLTVTVKHPDLDVRVRHIQARCKQYKVSLSRDQVVTLAQRYTEFRSLEGALLKFQAFSHLVQKNISDAEFAQILHHQQDRAAGLTPERIIAVVAGHLGLAPKDLTGTGRQKPVAQARQLALALCRDLTGASYPALGRIFGGKDHSTVLYAVKKIERLMADDKDTKKMFQTLRDKCQAMGGH